jgi:hypothetical protein
VIDRLLGPARGRLRISKLGLRPPAPAPGRHGVGLAAIVRDEAPYMGEWLRFHLAAGVRRVVIYDDGSTDGTAEAVREAAPGAVVIPWAQRLSDARLGREVHNQVLAYAHAASNFGGDLRWMGFLDPDEFLVPLGGPTIPEALEGLDVPCVALPWHMFGHGGNAVRPAGGVVESYLRRAADPFGEAPGLRAFKYLADPCRLTALRVHSCETDGRDVMWNDRGEAADARGRRARAFSTADRLQLNHYYARSREELEAKIARGPNLPSKRAEYRRKVERTVASIEAATVEDTRARDWWRAHGDRGVSGG